MPYGKSYSKEPAPGVPADQRRAPARTVSYDNTKRRPMTGSGTGKFGGLPKGPSGGAMNSGGKRRPGRFGQ